MICPVLLDFAWQDILIGSTRTLDVYLSGPDTAAFQVSMASTSRAAATAGR